MRVKWLLDQLIGGGLMMKKRMHIAGFVCLLCVLLCACGKTGTAAEGQLNKITADDLTDAQKEYLSEQYGLSDDALAYISKETINYYLLGTGLELYNKTKGVEVNGTEYTIDDDFTLPVSTSEKLITIEEAISIRMKEDGMRLQDFTGYKFTTQAEGTDSWTFFLPVDGYNDTYVRFRIIADNREITLKTPHLFYSTTMQTGYTFSILYDRPDFYKFVEDGKYSSENLFYAGIIYGTVTNESLVIKVMNSCKETKFWNSGYKIYKGNGDREEIVCEGKITAENKVKQEGETFSIEPVLFPKQLGKGYYTINIGDGFLVETFEIK